MLESISRMRPRGFNVPSEMLVAVAIATACDSSTEPGQTAEPFEIAFISGADLYRVRSDGAGLTRITNDDINERWYAWSPDGSRIAIVRVGGNVGPDLFVMNGDGGDVWNVTESPGQWDGRISWSPDGSALAYGHPSEAGGWDIYLARMDGSPPVLLTPPADASHDGWPSWSPDGSRIAFVSTRDGRSDIHVMNADGSNPTNLTETPELDEGYPDWSPDGARIVFTSEAVYGNAHVHVMNADGSGRVALTAGTGTRDYPPTWSPDGSMILFTRYTADYTTSDVFVMGADGSDPRNVSNHQASDDVASWSPDGSLIAFQSGRDGVSRIYVVAPDGSGLRPLIEPAAVGVGFGNRLESERAWRPRR